MRNYAVAVVPARNVQNHIGELVRRLKSKNPKHPKHSLDVIVVVDHCDDKTYEKAKAAGAIVINNGRSYGKGEALKTGFELAIDKGYEYGVFIDGDLQYSPEQAKEMVRVLSENGSDIILGYRKRFQILHKRHKIGNFIWDKSFDIRWRRIFNLFNKTKNKYHIKDVCCGLLAFKFESLKKINFTNLSGGYTIDSAIRIEAIKKNLNISQMLVDVKYNGKSPIVRGSRMVLGISAFIWTGNPNNALSWINNFLNNFATDIKI